VLRSPLLLALGLVLSGCLGGGSSQQIRAPPEPDPVSPASASSTGAAAANGTDAASSSAVARSTPVQYSGTTFGGACAFAVTTGQCQFPQAGKETMHDLKPGGKPQHLAGTVTWTSTAPGTSFYAYACVHEGSAILCRGKAVTGPSPLAFDFDVSAYNATDTLALGVDNEIGACCPLPAGAFVFPQADFKVDARLTTSG